MRSDRCIRLLLHGGGFKEGDEFGYIAMNVAADLVAAGYYVAIPTYPLAPCGLIEGQVLRLEIGGRQDFPILLRQCIVMFQFVHEHVEVFADEEESLADIVKNTFRGHAVYFFQYGILTTGDELGDKECEDQESEDRLNHREYF